jgi:hypothetical protein
MLIECKLKFGKKGLIITQRIERDATGVQIKPQAPIKANALGATFVQSKAQSARSSGKGGGPSPKDIGGGPSPRDIGGDGEFGPSPRDIGGTGAAAGGPVTIIGPIILTCSPDDETIQCEDTGPEADENELE